MPTSVPLDTGGEHNDVTGLQQQSDDSKRKTSGERFIVVAFFSLPFASL